MNVEWIRCTGNQWCNLRELNLDAIQEEKGVYIIWHGGSPSRTVRIGQGDLKDRLEEHRKDEEILSYQEKGLFVTWAEVPESCLDGVENYLAGRLPPLVGVRFPDADPIAVNLPWW